MSLILADYDVIFCLNANIANADAQIPKLSDVTNLEVLIMNWFNLGLKLGITEYELCVIEDNYPRDNKACKRKMFSTWLKLNPNSSYPKLIKALQEIGEMTIANDLCRKHGKIYGNGNRYSL